MYLLTIKRLFTVLLIAILLLPACSSRQDESATVINWLPYAEGLQSASTHGKKVFLYFRADW